jgi:hypothetical protein
MRRRDGFSYGRLLRPRLEPLVVGLLLVGPAIAWAAIDRSIWQWDQSWYGSNSIDLWQTLRSSPGAWVDQLFAALKTAPPGIVWLGQFFVPLGAVTGSTQAALLLSVALTELAAVVLLYATCLRLTEGRRAPALAGTVVGAGAPLVVNLSHWYLVEPLQSLAVIWVLYVLVSSRNWHLSLTVVQLVGALSLAVIAKLSTPVYVVGPVVGALAFSALATRRGLVGRGRDWMRDPRLLASAVPAILLAYAAARWYRLNFHEAWAHAQLASTSLIWGTRGSFLDHLTYWLETFRSEMFFPYLEFVAAAILAAGVLVALRTRRFGRGSLDSSLLLLACLATPVATLVLLAGQVNNDPRFLAASIPAVGVLVAGLLDRLRSRPITALVLFAAAAQFTLVLVADFAVGAPAWLSNQSYRSVPASKSTFAAGLERIVRVACPSDASGRPNIVGTSYPWLNANTLNFVAADQLGSRWTRCSWVGVAGATSDVDAGWSNLVGSQAPYFLTVDYGNARNPLPRELRATEYPAVFNQINAGVLRRVTASGRYRVVPGTRRSGLVAFRLVQTG